MIFGWGNGSSQFVKSTFWYFHIMLILRITLHRKWILVIKNKENPDAQAVVEKSKVIELLGYDPVNVFWLIFNQSLVWFVVGSILWSAANGHKYSPYQYYQRYTTKSSLIPSSALSSTIASSK
jgi:hypothetical protein